MQCIDPQYIRIVFLSITVTSFDSVVYFSIEGIFFVWLKNSMPFVQLLFLYPLFECNKNDSTIQYLVETSTHYVLIDGSIMSELTKKSKA